MESKELPEGLVKEVAKAIHDWKYEANFYERDGWLQDEYKEDAQAALSVIAPYYEKQIASIKEQMQGWIDYHNDRADIAEKHIAELKAQIPQWLSIETAPKTGQIVILYGKTPYAEFDYVGVGHWYKSYNRWAYDNFLGDEPKQPTHWMPLPKPPTE